MQACHHHCLIWLEVLSVKERERERERERDVCIKGKKDDGRRAAAEDRGGLQCYFFGGMLHRY